MEEKCEITLEADGYFEGVKPRLLPLVFCLFGGIVGDVKIFWKTKVNKIITLLVVFVCYCGCFALPQSSFVVSSKDSSVVATSKISKFDFVEELQVKGPDFVKYWYDEPIPDSTPCFGISDLTSTCVVLQLPLISNIETFGDSIAILFGACQEGAIPNRQLILLDLASGKLLGWYGYFTGRGDETVKFMLDMESRILVIGANENKMVEEKFYVVDRERMQYRVLEAEGNQNYGIEMHLSERISPTNLRKGYYVLHW
ncbi:MAG TPA: hypothetical protein VHS96_16715 [Bacteroidia bacterium]|nr:hypothetical protein [Bacteroidia bacterium]